MLILQFERTVPSNSIAQLADPEGASSNPALANGFSVDVVAV